MQNPLFNIRPKSQPGASKTFFVTAKTAQGKALLQSERMANLFIEVLRSYKKDSRMKVHEFLVMRNYVELIISVYGETTIEQALRRIKGKFVYHATLKFEIRGWIWDREMKLTPIRSRADFLKHKSAMEQAPVNAALAESADDPYCSAYLRKRNAAAKAVGLPSE